MIPSIANQPIQLAGYQFILSDINANALLQYPVYRLRFIKLPTITVMYTSNMQLAGGHPMSSSLQPVVFMKLMISMYIHRAQLEMSYLHISSAGEEGKNNLNGEKQLSGILQTYQQFVKFG